MSDFFALAADGVTPVNTIGNRCYLMGARIIGDVHCSANLIGIASDSATDLMLRESILTPKDPYYSKLNTENGVV